MYAIKKSLYLSVSAIILCGGGGSVANYDIIQNTHTTHISALASAPSYQVASITWLPDYDENEKTWGKYVISKGTGGGHGKGDGCDSKYNLSECPDHGVCEDCSTNKSKLYFKGCESGYKTEPAGSMNCILDCTPKTCEIGFSVITNKDVHAEYDECEPGCNEPKQYRFSKCEDGYFLEDNKCVACEKTQPEGSCPDGNEWVNGCQKADGKWYGDCADCRDENSPNNPCKGFHLCGEDTVPTGETCECGGLIYAEKCMVEEKCRNGYRPSTSEENCKSGIWFKGNNGCYNNLGYYLSSSITPCTSNIDGKQYWPSGYSHKCNDSHDDAPCKGFLADSDCNAAMGVKDGTLTCSCGGKTYYKECKDNKCHNGYRPSTPEENCKSGIWFRSINGEACYGNLGYYLSSSITPCTSEIDGKQYWPSGYSHKCNDSHDDAPCKGYFEASGCHSSGTFPGGETCECGGATFYSSCLGECNYEETIESCQAKGKKFIFKCAGNNGIHHGE